jgi:hypothetical protein
LITGSFPVSRRGRRPPWDHGLHNANGNATFGQWQRAGRHELAARPRLSAGRSAFRGPGALRLFRLRPYSPAPLVRGFESLQLDHVGPGPRGAGLGTAFIHWLGCGMQLCPAPPHRQKMCKCRASVCKANSAYRYTRIDKEAAFFSFAFAQGAGGAASSWLRVATDCRLTGQPCSSFLFITCACSRQCVVYHRARRRASPAVSSDRTWGGVCVLLLRGEAGGAKREARERAEPRALDPGSSAGCWCCPLALAGCLPWPLIGRSATWKPTVGLNSASWLPFGWLVRLLPSAPETQFQFLAGSWLARVGALKARPFALALEGN